MIKINDMIISQPVNDQDITILKNGEIFVLKKELLFSWISSEIENEEIKKFEI